MKKIYTIAICIVSAIGLSWGDLLSEGKKDYSEKKFASALDKFKEARTKDGDSPMLSLNIGTTYFRLEKFEDAIAEFQKATQKGQGIILRNAWYNLGNTWYRKGQLNTTSFVRIQNFKESILAYKEALDQDEDYDNARRNIEFVQKKLREEQDRLKSQSQPQYNKPLSRPAKDALAKAVQLTNDGKFKDAKDVLVDALKDDVGLKTHIQRIQDVIDIFEGRSIQRTMEHAQIEPEAAVGP
jgi:tetratricopeptide (TPR) repeat protein